MIINRRNLFLALVTVMVILVTLPDNNVLAESKYYYDVPVYDQDDFNGSCTGDCSPTAAGMVLGWYDSHGWPRMVHAGSNDIEKNPLGVMDLVHDLSNESGYVCNSGTSVEFHNLANAIENSAKNMDPAANFDTNPDEWVWYWQLKDCINDHGPLIFDSVSGLKYYYGSSSSSTISGKHTMTMIGYDDGGIHYSITSKWVKLNMGWGDYKTPAWVDFENHGSSDLYDVRVYSGGTPTSDDDDSYEDNDKFEDAKLVTTNSYSGLKCNDEDWFDIYSNSGTLEILISFTHSNGDLDLELYNSSKNRVAYSNGSSNSENISYEVNTSGYYYVKIFGYQGAKNNYNLSVTHTPPTLSYITISGSTQVNENSGAQYTCTAYYSDGSTSNVTSSASWSENSSYTSISSNGYLTTSSVSSDQSCTITAIYGGKSDTHSVTIKNVAATLSYITISGLTQVNENSGAQYACKAYYSDGSSSTVTSSASWSENSSYASINSSGYLTTYSVSSDQSCTISASYGGKSDTHSVTIKNIEPDTGYASVSQGVTVTPTSVVLNQDFTVSFTLKEVNGTSITFENIAVAILRSDNSHLFDFATYSNVTIAANGTWSRAPTGQIYDTSPPGTYKAIIRGKVSGGNWFDFGVTDSGINPRSFTVENPVTLSYIIISGPTQVDEESSAQYTCTAYYDDSTSSDVTNSTNWSENSSYTSINSYGYLTTSWVPSDQSCRITATYGDKTDTHDIIIKSVWGKISGTVTRDIDGQPITGLSVYAYDHATGSWGGSAETQSDGSYTITSLQTSSYRVQVDAWGTDYAREYYNNVYDYNSATSVDVTMGQTTSGIDFGLAIGGKITGVVTRDSDGQPIAGLSVSANADAIGYWGSGSSAKTQSDGSYTITGLPTGSYRVQVDTWETDYVREYYDNTYDYNSATSVDVTMGQTTSGIDFGLAIGGKITGVVTRDSDGQPIAGLSVSANADAIGYWGSGSSAKTQSDGSYTITGLPTGSYRVQVDTWGTDYAREYYNNVYDYKSATPVDVMIGQTRSGIDFGLAIGGKIRGTIYEADGINPVSTQFGVVIEIFAGDPCGHNDWIFGINDWIFGTSSDPSDGTYEIRGIPPQFEVYLKTNNYSASDYINEWYSSSGSTPDCRQAESLSVNSGEIVEGKDFQLEEGGSISGTLQGVSAPFMIMVGAYSGDACGQRQLIGSTTWLNPDGSFQIRGLPDGQYYLQTSNMDWSNYVNEWWASSGSTYYCIDAEAVTISSGGSVEGLEFDLDLGGSISGTLFQSNGQTKVSNANISVEVRSGSPCETNYQIAGTTTHNGTYMIRGVPPGTWYLQTDNMSLSDYHNEWWTNENSTENCNAAETFIIGAGNALPGYDFQLDSGKKGDLNGDHSVDLSDAILALQVISGMNPSGIRSDYTSSGTDVNNDGKIGIEEVIYILQKVSGLRE